MVLTTTRHAWRWYGGPHHCDLASGASVVTKGICRVTACGLPPRRLPDSGHIILRPAGRCHVAAIRTMEQGRGGTPRFDASAFTVAALRLTLALDRSPHSGDQLVELDW